MSARPPPFEKYVTVSGEELWGKLLSGKIVPHIYSSEAKGDYDPVPISSAEFFTAEEAGRDEDGELDHLLKPYQIMWRDRDGRRPAATRRAIAVPHWVYVLRADLTPKQRGPGAAEKYDWDDIEQFIRKLFVAFGDFQRPENRTPEWKSQSGLIERVKDYLQRRNQEIPGETQLKKKVGEILKRVRSELATDH